MEKTNVREELCKRRKEEEPCWNDKKENPNYDNLSLQPGYYGDDDAYIYDGYN